MNFFIWEQILLIGTETKLMHRKTAERICILTLRGHRQHSRYGRLYTVACKSLLVRPREGSLRFLVS